MTSSNRRIDPTFVRAQIELLRVTHPDIWEHEDEDQLLIDMLEAETELHEFLRAVVGRMHIAGALVAGIGELLVGLKARQDRFERRIDAMRVLAFKLMTVAEVRKIELPEATLSIRTGIPRVIITDEARLPPDCIRTRTEPDKVAIKEHLARGEPVPGAELSNSPPTLAVRIK